MEGNCPKLLNGWALLTVGVILSMEPVNHFIPSDLSIPWKILPLLKLENIINYF
jgi:hypothetical protein